MQLKIGVIGIGKLGICFSMELCKLNFVKEVVGFDVSESYIRSFNDGTFNSLEPQVNNLYNKYKHKFKATLNKEELSTCDVTYVFVQTPSLENGEYDHSQILECLSGYKDSYPKLVVVGCTTFPGFCEKLQEKLGNGISVFYSPLFIAQGNIVRGITHPDFVLVGAKNLDSDDLQLIKQINTSVTENNCDIHTMSLTEAEITKLALNCFITTKIAYCNMVGDIVKTSGGDPSKVLKAISTDSRVGSRCMKYGFGFGGPCFPRDNRALSKFASNMNVKAEISKASDISNKDHLEFMIQEVLSGKVSQPVEIPYLSYKKDSYLIECSQQLEFAIRLKNLGVSLNILENRKEVLDQIKEKL